MTETLFGASTVLLFGRVVEDLVFGLPEREVEAAATVEMDPLQGLDAGDGTELADGDVVLVHLQTHQVNGLYEVTTETDNDNNVTGHPWHRLEVQPPQGAIIMVKSGAFKGFWKRMRGNPDHFKFKYLKRKNLGKNKFLESQQDDMIIARIYGFSYEGTYYDLPRTVLFGVHGEGEPAVLSSNLEGNPGTDAQLARAPREPSISGVGAADFGIADDMRVWSYDKADYTVRMDVETGMFEQVLLEAYFAEGQPVSGMRVSGMRVSGMRVAGMRVSGMRVAGARGRGDAGD